MTLGRRELVGWATLGLGAFALEACGGPPPWPRPPTLGPDEVEHLLAELDGILANLDTLETDPARFGMKAGQPYVASGEALSKRLLATLCCLGSFRDIPESVWKDPRLEDRLARLLPRAMSGLDEARKLLRGMTDDLSAEIDKKLHDEPGLPMRILERVDEYAKKVRVPLEQRTYVRSAMTQLAGRFRYEGVHEVSSKLVAKLERASVARRAELGMPAEGDATQPNPVRAQFRTRSSADDVHRSTCALDAKVTFAGAERRIVLDWEAFQCPTTTPASADDKPVHGTVHTEPSSDGTNVVTVTLFPPPEWNDQDAASATVVSLARELRSRLSAQAASFAGEPCNTSADCGPLRCVQQVCVDPFVPPQRPMSVSPPVEARVGVAGESCRTKADCESPLVCSRNVCTSDESSSERLMKTTKQVAKIGAYLSIPPICAIGALVLLCCLFMVIVAGCMYGAGD